MGLNFLKSIKPYIAKYEPELLMSMGISGMIFSTIWGIRASLKASKIIEQEQKRINEDANKKNEPAPFFSTKDKIHLVWKLYIPVGVSILASVPCIIAGNRISNGRNMALAAAYTLSETALQEYQEKTKNIGGDKIYEKINESISEDRIKKTYKEGASQITLVGDGESLFYEPLSGRYFKTNWNRISKAANELNARSLTNLSGNISIGDWFDILGLEQTELDDVLGWVSIDGPQGLIDISIDSVLTPDNQPCGAIRYNSMPKPI